MRLRVIALSAIVLLALVACNQDGGSDSVVGQSSNANSSAVLQVGAEAPALTVANTYNNDGVVPSLDNLEGKVVVLDYWAYW